MIENLKELFQVNSLDEFAHKFATVDACNEWLCLKKWEDGYVCLKCGHTNYCKGNSPSSRRCTRCKYVESATANTAFHKCKIPIQEAFLILFTAFNDRNQSIRSLSKSTETRNMTCWRLRKKFEDCLQDGKCSGLFSK